METPENILQHGVGLKAQLPSAPSNGQDNEAGHSLAAEHKRLLHDKALLNTARTDLILLEEIRAEIASMTTPLQFTWNSVFQTVCVIIAFLFGVFSIFSWRGQKIGNNQSLHANQLAVIAICLTSNSSEIADTCNKLLPKVSDSFAIITAKSFIEDSLGGTSVWPWPVSYSRELDDPTGLIIMIVIPVACGAVGLYASRRIYGERFSR